jgi:hypothetical protein
LVPLAVNVTVDPFCSIVPEVVPVVNVLLNQM